MINRKSSNLLYPYSVRISPKGDLYIVDTFNHRIRKLEKGELIVSMASPEGKMIRFPADVAFGDNGDAFVSDSDRSHVIKKSGSSGLMSQISPFKVDKKEADELAFPTQIDFFEGKLYVSDTMNDRILVIDASSKVGCSIPVKRPLGLVVNRATKEITFTQRGVNKVSVFRDGEVQTLAGSSFFGLVDGASRSSAFFEPFGLSSREDGSIVVADAGNHAIRIIDKDGYTVTLAGGKGKGQADGTEAKFNYPMGVAVDSLGSVFVADTYNHRVRKILPNLEVETVI